MKRFLWADDGMVTYFHDIDDGKFTIEHVQDVEDTLEINKKCLNEAPRNWKGDYHHVASLPPVVYNDLTQKGIMDDWPALKKWLTDPDNRYFRVKEGRL